MIPNLRIHLEIVQATETRMDTRRAVAKTLTQVRNPVMDYMVSHPDMDYRESPFIGGLVVVLIPRGED